MESILQGISIDLNGLGPNIGTVVSIFGPFVMLAGGIIVAPILLRKGLGLLKQGSGK